jgi:hypothetical protein
MRANLIWNSRVIAVKERLQEPVQWLPFPILIASGLCLFLTAHILSGANPRAGHPANVMTFPAKSGRDSAIWLSVAPIDGEIIITTADRHIFRWPQNQQNMPNIDPMVRHLRSMIENEIESAALAKRALKSQTIAIIAADQNLAFYHMRPIISALSQAGISRYAFETLNPDQTSR